MASLTLLHITWQSVKKISVFRVTNQCPSTDIYYSDHIYSTHQEASQYIAMIKPEISLLLKPAFSHSVGRELLVWLSSLEVKWSLASDCKTGIMINCIKDNKYQSCYPSYREWRRLINVLVAQVSASLSDSLMMDVDWWYLEHPYFHVLLAWVWIPEYG